MRTRRPTTASKGRSKESASGSPGTKVTFLWPAACARAFAASTAAGGPVDAQDLARLADQRGGKQGDVAVPAPDVQDAHALRQAGSLEHTAREWFKKVGLGCEAL